MSNKTTEKDIKATFWANVDAALEARGWTYAKLGKTLGYKSTSLYTAKTREAFTANWLSQISSALDVHPSQLLSEIDIRAMRRERLLKELAELDDEQD